MEARPKGDFTFTQLPLAHTSPSSLFACQVLVLETVRQRRRGEAPPARFVIANIHVLFNPKVWDTLLMK